MSICCSNLKVRPLFRDIKEKDYLAPYKLLSSTLKTDYYKKQIKSGKINDDIFLKYLMCRPKMRIYIFDKQQDFIEEFVDIDYYKKIILNQKKYSNLILQLKSITQKFDDIKVKTQQVHHLHIFFTEEDISKKYELEGNPELLYQSKSFIESIINAKLLLNENSLKYLEYQRFDRIIKFKKSILKFNKFMVWMYKNMSLFELEIIITWSGIVSYSFGLRDFNDFDLFTELTNKNNYNKITKKFLTLRDKDLDIDIPDLNKKNNKLILHLYIYKIQTDSLKLISNKQYTNSYIYYNPKFYYYFYGLKLPNLITNTYYRFIRGRSSQCAELISYNKILNINIPIPKIPNNKYYIDRYINSHKQQEDYYIHDKEYDYYINAAKAIEFEPKIMKETVNHLKYSKLVSNYLKNKYRFNMSENEVLNYLTKYGVSTISEFKEIVSKI